MGDSKSGALQVQEEILRFGPFEFREDSKKLRHHGITRRIENQPAILLSYLIEHRGRLVTRLEVIQLLWPNQEHWDFEHRLDKVIAKLRFVLQDDAVKPKFIETIRGRGFQFIADVIYTPHIRSEKEIDRKDLEDGLSTVPGSDRSDELTSFPVPAKDKSAWLSYAIAAGVLVTILSLGLAYRAKAHRNSSSEIAEMPSVVVLQLRPKGEREQDTWMSRATTMWLSDDIEDHGGLNVFSGFNLDDLYSTLPDHLDNGLSAQLLKQIHERSGADMVVFGNYSAGNVETANTFQVELWVQDTRRHELLQHVTVLGRRPDAPSIIQNAQDLLCAKLGLASVNDKIPGFWQAPLPDDAPAARLYSEATLAMRNSDFNEAGAMLTQAASLEPHHIYTHALLTKVWLRLGDQRKAQEEYDLASHGSHDLSPREQTELRALNYEVSDDWIDAANCFRQLVQENPANTSYRLEAGSAQINAGQSADALRTLPAPSERPGTGIGIHDAEILLVRSIANGKTSNFQAQLKDASHAEQSARMTGQKRLAAEAAVQEGSALYALGNWDEAQGMWQRAMDTFDMIGDRRSIASVLYQQSRMLWSKRDPVKTRQTLERSIQLSEDFGNDPDRAAALAFLGVVRMYSDADPFGEDVPVRSLFAKANAIYERNGNRAGQGVVLGLVGDLDIAQSKCDRARLDYTKAMELSEAASDQSSVANRLLDLGIVAAQVGDNATAERDYTRSMDLALALGQQDRAAIAQTRLSGIFFREDRLDDAERLDEKALATLKSIGFVHNEVLENLAIINIEINPARAEAYARENLASSSNVVDPRTLSNRYMKLAETQEAEGKWEDARITIQQATHLEPILFSESPSSELLRTRAKLNIHDGKFDDARKDLRKALELALRIHSKPDELLNRLTRAELDLQNRSKYTRTELEQLEHDCQQNGFLLIARKIRADLASIGIAV